MTSAAESAEALRKEAERAMAEADRLTRLQAEFPDLRRHEGRWKKVVYCSKSVNQSVDDFESRHNCGCCNDSPLEVWPYKSTPEGRVYTDPPCFFVGERDVWGYGDRAHPDWGKGLRTAGIPEPLIERIGRLMKHGDEPEDTEADGD